MVKPYRKERKRRRKEERRGSVKEQRMRKEVLELGVVQESLPAIGIYAPNNS